jgi:hypothetical protein
MKIKLSRLRKIINEELCRHLNEADGGAAKKADDLKIDFLNKEIKKHKLGINQARVQIAQRRVNSADADLDSATQAAHKSAADAAVTTELDSIDYDDELIDEDEDEQRRKNIREIIRKTKGKKEWCLYSKKNNKSLGCYDSRKGAKKRDHQVSWFVSQDKKK